jgi:hypothetical protein
VFATNHITKTIGKPQQNAFIESFIAIGAMKCSTRPCSARSPHALRTDRIIAPYSR